MSAQLEDGSLSYIPVVNIEVQKGFNPRKHFNDAEDKELQDSILSQGIIQPIIVRPQPNNPDRYFVVAGERRFRSAQIVKLDEVPVSIRLLNDEEARVVALIENSVRMDMSLGEEAVAAREILKAVNGDKEEAMKRLGWKKSKFNARILLTHANQNVLDALSKSEIKVGMAELLSQLPSVMQDKSLISIIENNYTIAEVKERLSQFTQSLTSVFFDVSDCQGCPHNSSTQASIFQTSIGAGHCANQECYSGKIQSALLDKKEQLKEKYNTVFFDTEKLSGTCRIVSEGLIGDAYKSDCHQCESFGALVCTAPAKVGKVAESVCFSLDCMKAKIASYNKETDAKKAPVVPKNDTPKAQIHAEETNTENNAVEEQVEDKPVTLAKIAPVTPKKVSENIDTFLCKTASEMAYMHREKVTLAFSTYALFKSVHFNKSLLPDSLTERITSHNLDAVLGVFYDVSSDELLALQNKIITHLFVSSNSLEVGTESWVTTAQSFIAYTKEDLSDYFIVNKEFLSAHNKSGMESILREAVNYLGESFVKFYEKANGENSFSKLVKSKNDEIVDLVFKSGFNFTGFVPLTVQSRIK